MQASGDGGGGGGGGGSDDDPRRRALDRAYEGRESTSVAEALAANEYAAHCRVQVRLLRTLRESPASLTGESYQQVLPARLTSASDQRAYKLLEGAG